MKRPVVQIKKKLWYKIHDGVWASNKGEVIVDTGVIPRRFGLTRVLTDGTVILRYHPTLTEAKKAAGT